MTSCGDRQRPHRGARSQERPAPSAGSMLRALDRDLVAQALLDPGVTSTRVGTDGLIAHADTAKVGKIELIHVHAAGLDRGGGRQLRGAARHQRGRRGDRPGQLRQARPRRRPRSPRHRRQPQRLGAHGTRQDDLILDIAGNPALSRLRRALTPHGAAVFVAGERSGVITGLRRQLGGALLAPVIDQRLVLLLVRERSSDYERLARLVESGRSCLPGPLLPARAGRLRGVTT